MDHPGRPPVTLEHVARAAGVSRATASRALTGSGPSAAGTRERVQAVAEQLGYVADPVARALVSGRGTRVVVAVTGMTADVLDDAYLARVVTTTARVSGAEGLGVALQWLPLDRPWPTLEQLSRDRTVAGAVLVNTTAAVLAGLPRSLRGRAVSIGASSPDVPAFDVDNGHGVRVAVSHLVRSGRRRIAMITGPAWLSCPEAGEASYAATVRAAGLPVRMVPGDFTVAAGRAGVHEVLRRWPDTDAVYAVCDDTALGALAVLQELGRQVPGDVAVAGFDDVPAAASSGPGLTTATHPVEQIAAAAAHAVLHRPDRGGGVTRFPSELVVRASA
ncbi:LacI family DNA-binding transcriptional regulator [Modestobacter versicolor]|uniref:LacI family DNA-binding transcriptional regulator n=1 Tax=Modestobacter versicolor TaxID=429133 RepID=UPI0034DFBCA1